MQTLGSLFLISLAAEKIGDRSDLHTDDDIIVDSSYLETVYLGRRTFDR